jgi:hypothetical protein
MLLCARQGYPPWSLFKRAYPVVQVAIFDAEEGQSEVIVLPPE